MLFRNTKIGFCFLLIISTFLCISSCSKPGTGGDCTLVVFPQHNGKAVMNHPGWPDTVFVKYNATSSPGTKPGNYDTYFVGEAGEDHVHCTGLKWGQYYLYTVGMDSTEVTRVKGGLAFKVLYSERKEEIPVTIPTSN